MELLIDRTSYRRSNRINSENSQNEEIKTKRRGIRVLFLNETIISMVLLIIVLSVKVMNLKEIDNWIENEVNSGISCDLLISNVVNYCERIKQEVKIYEETIKKEEVEEKEKDGSGERSLYETAVEGISQLSDDALKVKEKFSLVRPIKEGIITSRFGVRQTQNSIVSSYHTGLDIADRIGTTIFSSHDGIVTMANNYDGYGKCIMITSGELTTLYGHCSQLYVSEGKYVQKGEKIGEVGMTGNATGPHVHFEVRYEGRFVNPEDII